MRHVLFIQKKLYINVKGLYYIKNKKKTKTNIYDDESKNINETEKNKLIFIPNTIKSL